MELAQLAAWDSGCGSGVGLGDGGDRAPGRDGHEGCLGFGSHLGLPSPSWGQRKGGAWQRNPALSPWPPGQALPVSPRPSRTPGSQESIHKAGSRL